MVEEPMIELSSVLNLLHEVKTGAQRRSVLNQLGLTHLGEGSGRSVFEIDSKRIIKLAKNPKGKAQNEAEADLSPTSPVLAKVLLESDDSDWVVAQNAQRISRAMFKTLTLMDFDDYSKVLRKWGADILGVMWIEGEPEKEESIKIEHNPFFQHVLQLMADGDLAAGDLGRINSYGLIDNKVVLRDYGLTREVFKKFYKKKKKDSSW